MYPERHIGSRGESRGETISGLPASRWSRAAWRVSGRALGRWGRSQRSSFPFTWPLLLPLHSEVRRAVYSRVSTERRGAFPSKTAADALFC